MKINNKNTKSLNLANIMDYLFIPYLPSILKNFV